MMIISEKPISGLKIWHSLMINLFLENEFSQEEVRNAISKLHEDMETK